MSIEALSLPRRKPQRGEMWDLKIVQSLVFLSERYEILRLRYNIYIESACCIVWVHGATPVHFSNAIAP